MKIHSLIDWRNNLPLVNQNFYLFSLSFFIVKGEIAIFFHASDWWNCCECIDIFVKLLKLMSWVWGYFSVYFIILFCSIRFRFVRTHFSYFLLFCIGSKHIVIHGCNLNNVDSFLTGYPIRDSFLVYWWPHTQDKRVVHQCRTIWCWSL